MSAGQIPTRQVAGLDEQIRDIVGALLVAGANVSLAVNDAGDTVTIAATNTTDPEVVRDTMAAALVAGANVTITPNDAGDTITISSSGGSGGGSSTPAASARVYATASQIAAHATWTSAAFTNESFDTNAFHDNATNNTRLTIPTGMGGKYLVVGTVSFASDGTATGARYARILKNGVDVFGTVTIPPLIAQMRVPVAAVLDLVPGDYLEMQGRQTSGSGLEIGDTTAAGAAGETWFSLVKTDASAGLVKIAETELASAAATISFAAIPSTYRNLRLVLTARSSAAAVSDQVKLFANGDTTLANYKYKHFYGTTTTGYNSGADAQVGFVPGNTATASEAGAMDILLAHYAKTTFRKVFHSQFYTPGTPASGIADVVRLNTAAITDLTLALATGQFMAGTCATLYGMA